MKVNGVTYDIDYLRRNVLLESRSNAVDNPADKSLEVAEQITLQLTGNGIRESVQSEGLGSEASRGGWQKRGT
jgi:hypothetical protein